MTLPVIHTASREYPNITQCSAREYVVSSPFLIDALGVRVLIREGFRFDGFSVPRVFHWFQSPFTGKGTVAALAHDALYASELVPRLEADLIFRELLKMYGESVLKRTVLYQAVRRFGWYAWNSHDAGQVEIARDLVYIERMESTRNAR